MEAVIYLLTFQRLQNGSNVLIWKRADRLLPFLFLPGNFVDVMHSLDANIANNNAAGSFHMGQEEPPNPCPEDWVGSEQTLQPCPHFLQTFLLRGRIVCHSKPTHGYIVN